MRNSYWGETDRILKEEGAPNCPRCGKKMFPQDDHGRFTCFCSFGKGTNKIPQVKAENLSDEEKAKIPPINRLNMTPTKAEKEAGSFGATRFGCPRAIS